MTTQEKIEIMMRKSKPILEADTKIKRKVIVEALQKAEQQFPYRVQGDYKTYSEYNQGWTDAVDYIASLLGVEY